MKFLKFKNKAFTLIECLVALFVIGGSVELISSLAKLTRLEIVRSQKSEALDWQIFCNQLRSELDGAQFVKIDKNFLYVNKGSSQWRFGKTETGTDFRKSNADGRGYQPMLFNVESVQVIGNSELLQLNFNMIDGGDKVFYYKF